MLVLGDWARRANLEYIFEMIEIVLCKVEISGGIPVKRFREKLAGNSDSFKTRQNELLLTCPIFTYVYTHTQLLGY